MEEQVAIFCDADDFCKDYEKYCNNVFDVLLVKSQFF